MCNDPNHDPTPILPYIEANPGATASELAALAWADGITAQRAGVLAAIANEQRLIHIKQVGKARLCYPGPHPQSKAKTVEREEEALTIAYLAGERKKSR